MSAGPVSVAPLHIDVEHMRRRHESLVDIEGALEVPWLQGALRKTDAEVHAPGHLALQISLQPDGVVLVRGRLDVAFEVPCARCLEPAAVADSTEVCVTYSTAPRCADEVGGDEDLDLVASEVDEWPYDGSALDLSPMLLEQVALAYPMRALCARGEACRGLCSSCGADLNRQIGGQRRCAACGAGLGPPSGEDPGGAEHEGDATPWQRELRKLRPS